MASWVAGLCPLVNLPVSRKSSFIMRDLVDTKLLAQLKGFMCLLASVDQHGIDGVAALQDDHVVGHWAENQVMHFGSIVAPVQRVGGQLGGLWEV